MSMELLDRNTQGPRQCFAGLAPAKIDSLTGIRGLAALWVAWFHFSSYSNVRGINLGPVVDCGYWGVDVFFVLSGLVLAINYAPQFASHGFGWRDYWAFVRKRIARIYPLHLATFLFVFVFWKIAVYTDQSFPLKWNNNHWTELCNILMIHAWGVAYPSFNHPSWSISAEWFAYLFVFPLCVIGFSRRSVVHGLAIAGLLWIALIAYVFHYYSGSLALVTSDGTLRIIPEFIAGFALYRLGRAQRVGNWALLGGLSAIVTMTFMPVAALVLLLPAIMLLLYGLYSGGSLVEAVFANRVSVFLGEISYSIYMVHIIVAALTNHLFRLAGLTPTFLHSTIALIAETALTIGFAFVAYRFVEAPGRELVRARSRFRPVRAVSQ